MLMKRGVPVHQVVQQAGQLVVIPPNTFFASISCGYNISEHIHFLPQNWLINASKASNVISITVLLHNIKQYVIELS